MKTSFSRKNVIDEIINDYYPAPKINFKSEFIKFLYFIIILILFLLISTIVVADKTPRKFYLNSSSSLFTRGVCIKADQDWWFDAEIYCSDEMDRVLLIYEKIKK